ncbi:MAG: hypothetical protein JXX28_05420 [Deltaproteobacteria bacterium]|nr:hypothetical protein [Deltaproteobacteria bacterium]
MELVFTFAVFALAMVAFGLGQLFGRKQINGSCHADGGACACHGEEEHQAPQEMSVAAFKAVDAGLTLK